MELPTYTNIWKIEKRLYKLYDFRLPMPLPVGQVAAFAAIAIPYMLALTLVGMPFSHTWVWLYVLPPGAAAWLVTRPVLEGKRLPELVVSRARYLAEPRVWCRLAPLAEKDRILIVARVWRTPARPGRSAVAVPAARELTAAVDAASAVSAGGTDPRPDSGVVPASASARPAVTPPPATISPVLRVRAESAGGPLHVVERALRTSRGGWHDRVVVVPGGHRPGSPDYAQRDQARSRLPLAGPARLVVLGTTVGAGQTVTTLLTGQLLASLRGEAVAVLDFAGRPGSLTELARQVPRLLPARLNSLQSAGARDGPDRERGLQVVTAGHSGPGPRDANRLIDAVAARYPIVLADPAPADVPRAVQVADQLVLVTRAGTSSVASLAMTLEWLEAHGYARLAQTSVTVLNGVSRRTAEYAERAATVAAGRCRAIVRVPWDGNLGARRQLGIATVHAFTALAGVLVSGLADPAPAASAGAGSASR